MFLLGLILICWTKTHRLIEIGHLNQNDDKLFNVQYKEHINNIFKKPYAIYFHKIKIYTLNQMNLYSYKRCIRELKTFQKYQFFYNSFY